MLDKGYNMWCEEVGPGRLWAYGNGYGNISYELHEYRGQKKMTIMSMTTASHDHKAYFQYCEKV